MQMVSGTGSDWGDAVALLASMGTDSMTGAIPATLASAESLGSVVSNVKLWEEILRTREESDNVSLDRFEELLRSIGSSRPDVPPDQPKHDDERNSPPQRQIGSCEAEENLARAAQDVAFAASLQKMAAEISLEAHGYQPLRRLGGSTTATVMVVHRLGLPERQFVVKAIALRGLDAQGRRLTLVMECAENGDLRVPVQAAGQSGKHLEEVLVLSWLQQMLRGLDHVHQKEIIHRDLKAMNVFLKDTWRTCKLGDFGISTALESGKSASGCVGTPAYMAPELLWNQRYASAVDMWAIGVVLYELMALKLPFCGSNVLALVYQIAFNTYDPEPLCMVGYSTALIELVSWLLDKDPTKRPSASQLLGEPALWETFSIEAAGTMAAASFNESLSSNLFSNTCQGDLSE
ncbi:Nek4, partial [Symbiodinium sp. KB8]